MKKIILFLFSALSITTLVPVASAVVMTGAITCGTDQRTATLSSAQVCQTGEGNTQGNGSTINGYYDPTWTGVGSLEAEGTNNFLTSALTDGSWGDQNVDGTWAIDSSFWATYAEAVISIHVGNGGGSPDHFAWLITDNETSGTWSYDKLSGNGGGLSNMKLWGKGEAVDIPEPAPMALFLIGLLSLAAMRKSKKA